MRPALPLITVLLCIAITSGARANVNLCGTPSGVGTGINLSLDDCGGFGHWTSTIDCATNSGLALIAVASIIPPPGINRMVGVEGYFDVETSGRTISPWWSFDDCRASALTFSADFTGGPYNCNDFWAGHAAGGGGFIVYDPTGARLQFHCIFASPYEQAIDPQVEHYLFSVRISRAKSTGTGSCPGCQDHACLVLNHLVLVQPAGVGDAVITQPANGNHVLYGDHVIPAANRTWGQVKALYR